MQPLSITSYVFKRTPSRWLAWEDRISSYNTGVPWGHNIEQHSEGRFEFSVMQQWVDHDERSETWNSTVVCTPCLEDVCGQRARGKNSGWGDELFYLSSLVPAVCALLLSFQNGFCCNVCVFSTLTFQFCLRISFIYSLMISYMYTIYLNHIHPKVSHFLSPKTTPTTSSSPLHFFFLKFPCDPWSPISVAD